MERSKAEFSLGLYACEANQPEAIRPLRGIFKQRGLANSSLAAND
jgi:hypothetical protein